MTTAAIGDVDGRIPLPCNDINSESPHLHVYIITSITVARNVAI